MPTKKAKTKSKPKTKIPAQKRKTKPLEKIEVSAANMRLIERSSRTIGISKEGALDEMIGFYVKHHAGAAAAPHNRKGFDGTMSDAGKLALEYQTKIGDLETLVTNFMDTVVRTNDGPKIGAAWSALCARFERVHFDKRMIRCMVLETDRDRIYSAALVMTRSGRILKNRGVVADGTFAIVDDDDPIVATLEASAPVDEEPDCTVPPEIAGDDDFGGDAPSGPLVDGTNPDDHGDDEDPT